MVNGYEHCDIVDRANCDIVDDNHGDVDDIDDDNGDVVDHNSDGDDDNDNGDNADNFAWKKGSFGPLFIFVYQNISLSTFPISAHLRVRAIVVKGNEQYDIVYRANC